MTGKRGRAGTVAAALALLSAGGISACSDEAPTQPRSTLAYYVAPNSTVFPESVSTTGIPYIRVRVPGEVTRAGSLLDMNEAGWAVGSRIRAAGQPLVAVVVNVRTGDTNSIGISFADPSQAKAINGRGEVVGGEPLPNSSPGPASFHWRDGVLTPLGTGSAMDINDLGVAVGYARSGLLSMRPWVWHGGDLEFLSEGLGRANGINNSGDIVGVAPYNRIWKPTIWKGGVRDTLFSWPDSGEATGINEQGQVVGWAIRSGVREAFVWRKGVVTWLGTLQGGPSQATAINDRGEIVGNVVLPSETHAVLWRNDQIIDLGLSGRTVPFENVSEAFGITNSGQVVGRVGQGGNRNGVVWTPPPR